MSKPASVLFVGEDQVLLQTRTDILSYFWSVTACYTPDLDSREPERADLVVLCHSLAESKKLDLVKLFHARQPKPLMVMLKAPYTCIVSGCDRIVETSEGPAAMVSSIYQLLEENGLSSKAWIESQPTYFKD